MPLNIFNGEEHFQRGAQFHLAGRLNEAEACYRLVLQSNPRHAGALQNMGLLALTVGRNELAEQFLSQAAVSDPGDAKIHNSIGEVYRAMNDGRRALAAFDRAIALDAHLPAPYCNRAIIFAIDGKITQAIESLETAISLFEVDRRDSAGYCSALNNLGNAYLEQGEIQKAIATHQRACDIAPSRDLAPHSNLLRDYTNDPELPPAKLLALNRGWWERFGKEITPLSHTNIPDAGRRLRIGFVSPDFREHAVMYFLTGLFEHYDRDRFDFVCYSHVTAPDPLTAWLQTKATAIQNIVGTTDADAANLIQRDGIDILIDLAGHTAGNRLRLFAYRPAPIQVAYLGYPTTTGASTMDWRITDANADPPGMTEPHFSERLWRLPRTAWCYRCPVQVESNAAPPTLRGTPVTFGSFNSFAKLTPRMMNTWSKILHSTPDSRLLLKASVFEDEATQKRVRSVFAAEGIDPERVMLRGRQSAAEDHLRQYAEVDIALDTFPYAGTTTTCEALWMGVPVITLAGETHMSRVGASLLLSVGLQELICASEEQYIQTASVLAADVRRLEAMRAALRGAVEKSPLRDEKGFSNDFCDALRGMWSEWCEARVTR